MFGQLPAYFALLLFPFFALYVFARLPRAQSAALVVLAGSLFLPEGVAIDLPAVPPMDKEYVTFLSVLLAAMVHQGKALAEARVFRGPEAIVILMFFASAGTMLMNLQPMMDEGKLEDALGFYWLFANTVDDLLMMSVPFLVGRALFSSVDDLATLFKAMMVAGTIYFGLIIIEVIMSIPFHVWQLSNVFYGVPMRPMWRWGVIQPIIFMDNGLSLASYMAGATIGGTAILKAKLRESKWSGRGALIANFMGLLMSRNIAGNIYGFSLSILVALCKPRFVSFVAMMVALFVFIYPFLRMADVFPYEDIVTFAASIEPERARSLEGRFHEEDFVLENIGNRLYFGWGNIMRVPGAETFGQGETGIDGFWVKWVGTRGLFGVLLYTFMLAYPVWIARRVAKRSKDYTQVVLLSALMAIVAMRMGDLIINGWWNCLPMFLAGALLGVARGQGKSENSEIPSATAPAITR